MIKSLKKTIWERSTICVQNYFKKNKKKLLNSSSVLWYKLLNSVEDLIW